MYRIFKTIHLLGLTLFLGSVFGHIVAGQTVGAQGGANLVAARMEIVAATRFLTLPGLGLAIAWGLAMMFCARLSPLKNPWLAAHMILGMVVVVTAVAVVVPAGREALALVLAGDFGASLNAALLREHGVGAFNVVLTLVLVILGVLKPKWTRRTRTPS
jgi:hypothetical protein